MRANQMVPGAFDRDRTVCFRAPICTGEDIESPFVLGLRPEERVSTLFCNDLPVRGAIQCPGFHPCFYAHCREPLQLALVAEGDIIIGTVEPVGAAKIASSLIPGRTTDSAVVAVRRVVVGVRGVAPA